VALLKQGAALLKLRVRRCSNRVRHCSNSNASACGMASPGSIPAPFEKKC
jgi:hypothetical protein